MQLEEEEERQGKVSYRSGGARTSHSLFGVFVCTFVSLLTRMCKFVSLWALSVSLALARALIPSRVLPQSLSLSLSLSLYLSLSIYIYIYISVSLSLFDVHDGEPHARRLSRVLRAVHPHHVELGPPPPHLAQARAVAAPDLQDGRPSSLGPARGGEGLEVRDEAPC